MKSYQWLIPLQLSRKTNPRRMQQQMTRIVNELYFQTIQLRHMHATCQYTPVVKRNIKELRKSLQHYEEALRQVMSNPTRYKLGIMHASGMLLAKCVVVIERTGRQIAAGELPSHIHENMLFTSYVSPCGEVMSVAATEGEESLRGLLPNFVFAIGADFEDRHASYLVPTNQRCVDGKHYSKTSEVWRIEVLVPFVWI